MDDAEQSTILKRHTGNHTDSRPVMETVKLPYDPELTAQQTRIDDAAARAAHASQRHKEAQKELSDALDEFIKKTKAKSA